MNMPIPFNIENLVKSSVSPSGVRYGNNAAFSFYCRYLWQKLVNIFTYDLPDDWSVDMVQAALFGNGCCAVFPTAQYGVLASWATPGGYNVNYEPKFCVIANPLLPTLTGKRMTIGVDCAAIHITPDWTGVTDLIATYAVKLALAMQAIDVNLINSKIAYVFGAKNDAQQASFKAMMDRINTGEPAVVVDKSLFNDDGSANWNLFQQNLKQTYLVTDLLSDLKKIEDEFDSKVGIPNANTDKRERLITDEVNANNAETSIIAAGWLDHIHAGLDQVKAMYGLDIKIDWRYKQNDALYNADTKPGDAVDNRTV